MSERTTTELHCLETLPGISVGDLQPFVTLRAVSRDGGTILFTQATPDELRAQAFGLLEVAFVAENDARLARLCKETGLSDDVVAALIQGLERFRTEDRQQ